MPRVSTVNAASCTIRVPLSSLVISDDGVETATITVRVVDDRGLPVQGLAASNVVLSSTGTGNTLTQPTGVTNKNGEITGSFKSTVAETKTITATVRGTAITQSLQLVVRSALYLPLVYRDFNSVAANGSDGGTGAYPSKTGGSEGWDTGESTQFATYGSIEHYTDLSWLSGPSPFDDGNGNLSVLLFPVGYVGGTAPGTQFTGTFPGGAVNNAWFQFSFAFEPTYQAHPVRNKLVFWQNVSMNTFISLTASKELRFNTQGTPDDPRGDLANNIDSSAAQIVTDGRWYTILLQMISTGNNPTGTLRMWVCDHGAAVPMFKLTTQYTDINYGEAIRDMLYRPVWGGGGSTVTTDFRYGFDSAKVWGY